ncbi:DUF4333 domain-containing protein [Ornithinicoccus hortensis]|uniref:Uncharacterized protein DUF4333 n=1 Tax=Ornithinicoccus hortensis TaxID=82346 RepID=A0A542YLX6_9MICO|nr:DUF4333 domain-containing protein [Ornithinicoccus hortensis]TQL49095.1 uncharacterized protein DUF4333 [Ornithinicoccus hortensis]
MSRTRRVPLAAGALALAALGLAGCSQEVSAGDLEDSIREQADAQGLQLESVDCREGLPPEVGATVICDVEIVGVDEAGGQVDRIRVEAVEVNDDEVRFSLEPLAVGDPD